MTGGPLVPRELTKGPDRGGSLVVVLAIARQDDLTAIAALRPHYASTVVITIAGGPNTGVPMRIPNTRVIQAPNAKGGTRRWNVAAH